MPWFSAAGRNDPLRLRLGYDHRARQRPPRGCGRRRADRTKPTPCLAKPAAALARSYSNSCQRRGGGEAAHPASSRGQKQAASVAVTAEHDRPFDCDSEAEANSRSDAASRTSSECQHLRFGSRQAAAVAFGEYVAHQRGYRLLAPPGIACRAVFSVALPVGSRAREPDFVRGSLQRDDAKSTRSTVASEPTTRSNKTWSPEPDRADGSQTQGAATMSRSMHPSPSKSAAAKKTCSCRPDWAGAPSVSWPENNRGTLPSLWGDRDISARRTALNNAERSLTATAGSIGNRKMNTCCPTTGSIRPRPR